MKALSLIQPIHVENAPNGLILVKDGKEEILTSEYVS
jgi:hypothetical protein